MKSRELLKQIRKDHVGVVFLLTNLQQSDHSLLQCTVFHPSDSTSLVGLSRVRTLPTSVKEYEKFSILKINFVRHA